jgi:hypothetical protein
MHASALNFTLPWWWTRPVSGKYHSEQDACDVTLSTIQVMQHAGFIVPNRNLLI